MGVEGGGQIGVFGKGWYPVRQLWISSVLLLFYCSVGVVEKKIMFERLSFFYMAPDTKGP